MRPPLVSSVGNAIPPAETLEQQAINARNIARKWQAVKFMKDAGVSVIVTHPRVLFGNGYATQFEVIAGNVPTEGQAFINFATNLRNYLSTCRVERARSRDCRFDVLLPIESKVFSWRYVLMDLLVILLTIAACVCIALGAAYVLGWLPACTLSHVTNVLLNTEL